MTTITTKKITTKKITTKRMTLGFAALATLMLVGLDSRPAKAISGFGIHVGGSGISLGVGAPYGSRHAASQQVYRRSYSNPQWYGSTNLNDYRGGRSYQAGYGYDDRAYGNRAYGNRGNFYSAYRPGSYASRGSSCERGARGVPSRGVPREFVPYRGAGYRPGDWDRYGNDPRRGPYKAAGYRIEADRDLRRDAGRDRQRGGR